MSSQSKAVLVGGVAGALASLIVVVGLAVAVWLMAPAAIFAQTSHDSPSHEQMHQMIDAMHGAGTSDRMHEAMGPEGEKMMDQCVGMMKMMGMRQGGEGMMGGGGMQGMMGGS